METHSQKNFRVTRLLGSVALLGAGAGATVWLSPGGLGEADATEVTKGASASAYRSVAGAVADVPAWMASLLEVAGGGTLVILGLLLVRLCWTAVRRKDAAGAAGAVVIGVGTVAAYAISEALKLVVDEERPCRALRGVEAITDCPPTGDWSFPSNHATLAAALAVGLAMLWPRLATLTLSLAGAAALLRVLVGVHYPHDVLAGAILGGTVVAAVLLAVMPLGVRATSLLVRRWWEHDPGLVGHDGGSGPVVDA
ncbi:phosphatase PAP2 family protein [Streptomyces sp. NPDC056661]|uniref:phosphatase PAP2 family protein n=1 Tax=unclassified Streptomyces TaxID=2593676 RepID=UPI0036434ACD